MLRLIVRVIGTKEGTESILATSESDRYDPEHVDALINASLANALRVSKGANLDSLRSWCPEVSVILTTEDENVRPSLHLTPDTLYKLVEAGASFDFDPYV